MTGRILFFFAEIITSQLLFEKTNDQRSVKEKAVAELTAFLSRCRLEHFEIYLNQKFCFAVLFGFILLCQDRSLRDSVAPLSRNHPERDVIFAPRVYVCVYAQSKERERPMFFCLLCSNTFKTPARNCGKIICGWPHLWFVPDLE
jgi:hypothetical protein